MPAAASNKRVKVCPQLYTPPGDSADDLPEHQDIATLQYVQSDRVMPKPRSLTVIIVIGSSAWDLTPQNHPEAAPEGHTKGWRVYVKGLDGGPDITSWLKKVQFKLHHTYADASRSMFISSSDQA